MNLSLRWIDLCREHQLTDAEQLRILAEFQSSQLAAIFKPMLRDEREAHVYTAFAIRRVSDGDITICLSMDQVMMRIASGYEPVQREVTEYPDGSTFYAPWEVIESVGMSEPAA